MFAVIIPYFQRQPGVLADTLASIAAQEIGERVNVYVIDDASPHPPEGEVAAVAWPGNFRWRILRQANAGPGAARNRGLDALEDEEYVAFLDSDDAWNPYHLASAKFAFDHGFDFYTADWLIDDKGTRALDHYYGDKLDAVAFAGADWAFELRDELINYTVCGPIGSTCSMAVRRSLVSDVRFDPALRTAGEDGLFATCLAAKRPRVLISRRIDTRLGRGVNIFSSGGWNSPQAFLRAIYYLRSRLMMRKLVGAHPVARERLDARLAGARREVWEGFVACLKRRQLPPLDFLQLVAGDPALVTAAPATLRRMLARRGR